MSYYLWSTQTAIKNILIQNHLVRKNMVVNEDERLPILHFRHKGILAFIIVIHFPVTVGSSKIHTLKWVRWTPSLQFKNNLLLSINTTSGNMYPFDVTLVHRILFLICDVINKKLKYGCSNLTNTDIIMHVWYRFNPTMTTKKCVSLFLFNLNLKYK